jgi:hypothetical protein
MDSDQKEIQIVDYNNETYMITATQNRFDIQQMSGIKSGTVTSLVYEPNTASWFVEATGERVKVAEMDADNMNLMKVVAADGSMVSVNIDAESAK